MTRQQMACCSANCRRSDKRIVPKSPYLAVEKHMLGAQLRSCSVGLAHSRHFTSLAKTRQVGLTSLHTLAQGLTIEDPASEHAITTNPWYAA